MLIFLIFICLQIIVFSQNDDTIEKIIFEETFENKEINESIWNFELGNWNNGFDNNELEYNRKSKDNIFVKDNQLHIKANVENYAKQNYTSARITTKNTFHFTHGYLEAKIKLPVGKGIWPYFRLIGENIDEELWPGCGQINFIEAINEKNIIYNSLYWKNNETNEDSFYQQKYYLENINEFHIYGLLWVNDEIEITIDYQESFFISLNDVVKTDAFHKPFYLLIALAVGGNITGSEVDDSSFPLEMIIDYIKIYQVKEDYKYLKKLIFFDDFDDEDLNLTKWDFFTPNLNFNLTRQEFIFQSNSNLHLRLIQKINNKNITIGGGFITTENIMNFTYGIIKANISFPSSNFGNPTLNLESIISISESINIEGKSNNTIVSYLLWGKNYAYYRTSNYNINEFHEYTIFWDKEYISIYVEDLEIYKIGINSKEFIAFHNPLYLNLYIPFNNLYLLSYNKSLEYIEMIVDYIKIYNFEINPKTFKENKNEDKKTDYIQSNNIPYLYNNIITINTNNLSNNILNDNLYNSYVINYKGNIKKLYLMILLIIIRIF